MRGKIMLIAGMFLLNSIVPSGAADPICVPSWFKSCYPTFDNRVGDKDPADTSRPERPTEPVAPPPKPEQPKEPEQPPKEPPTKPGKGKDRDGKHGKGKDRDGKHHGKQHRS